MTSTTHRFSCRKCNAPESALYPHVRHLEIGARLQVVKCTLCGWEASRIEPHRRALPPVEKKVKKFTTLPCTRSGCNGSYSPNASKRQLCAVCGKAQGQWESLNRRGLTTRPAPLLKQGHNWIINPNRQPLSA